MIPRTATGVFQVGPRKVELQQIELGPVGDRSVLVKSKLSGISHGTELNQYRATTPHNAKTWDPSKRLFLPSEGRREGRPDPLGYENVGEVLEVGREVSSFQVGDLVWCWSPHVDYYIFEESGQSEWTWPPQARRFAFKLPPQVTAEEGIFTALGEVALTAVHDANVKVGDYVTVLGAGVIGLLCVQLAFINGARKVFVSEPIESRRKMAEAFGAIALDPATVDPSVAVREQTHNKGADVCIESSGNHKALHEAIRCAGLCGRVVALAFYQGGAPELRLGEEWHHNRVTMLSSMSVWLCPSRYYPQWDITRTFETVLDLIDQDKLVVDNMISHKIPLREAERAYRLIDEHPESVLKVAFVYE